MRILYLEDSATDADLTVRMLGRTAPDIAVEVVGTVAAALDAVGRVGQAVRDGREPPLDLLLLDVHLPDGNGVSVLAEVRVRALPLAVVVLTGSGDEQSVLSALRAGADDYVVKRSEYWANLASTLRSALVRFRSLEEGRGRHLRVLYVESTEHDVELTRRHLAASAPHIHLEAAGSADEALAILGHGQVPDVLLMDYRLPGMNALEALKEIRQTLGLDLPIVLVTGHGTQDIALQALKLGAADYLVKDTGYLLHLPSVLENAFHRVLAVREKAALIEREHELRESEARFRQLAENIREVFWLVDAQRSQMLYISPAYEQIWGRSRESLRASPGDWIQAIHPDDRQRIEEAIRTEQPKGTYDVEYRIVRPDGDVRWIHDRAFRVADKDGRLLRVAGVADDITEHKKAEEQLRESELQYRSLIEQASDGIYVTDGHGRLALANSRCCEMLGYDASELLGAHFSITYVDAERSQAEERMRQVLAGAMLRFERQVRRKDGRTFLAEFSSRMLDNGMIQVIFHDITKRRLAEDRLRESEERYRTLIEQASDGIFIADGHGRFLMVNTRGAELLGYPPDELVGLDGALTYLESERGVHAQRMHDIRAGKALHFERTVVRKDGSTFPAEVSVKRLDNGLVQVIFHDITLRRAQEHKIARLSRIQAVMSGINSAILRTQDRDRMLAEACTIAADEGAFHIAWIGLLDDQGHFQPGAWAGKGSEFMAAISQPHGRVPSSEVGVARRAVATGKSVFENDITRSPGIDPVRAEAVARGCRAAIALPLRAGQEVAGVMVLYASEKDVFDDEEVRLLEELAGDVSFALTFIAQREKVDYLAYYDSLTGLPNRSLLFDRLGRQVAAAERDQARVALMLVDVSRFRLVNESLGRQAGDQLIRAIAERIKASVREEDTVARMDADRFAVVVSGRWSTWELSQMIESRSQSVFGPPFALGGEDLRIAATVGAAIWPADAKEPEALLANAEAALRNAKQQKAALLFYSPEMNASVAESLRIETRLRRAIDAGELELWYQPKTDIARRVVFGVEALMRWRDPELGLVPPAKFIPVMEQSGLIVAAGNWALGQVARDCGRWSAAGIRGLRVAVNVSPIQFRQQDLIARVVEAASQAEAAGGHLDIELTESTIMDNVEKIIPQLQTIHGLGVEIYVDDFGTGYSSLAYIARLPIQALKIDRSFVIGMRQGGHSLNIVNSVISLAHSLKLRVVAEGVETEDQAELLGDLGCDQLQGYLVSQPLPAGEIPGLLARLG
jgi:diguanylate cyclase (GGDEF)-like protein/PAS domain S-box-containing protein